MFHSLGLFRQIPCPRQHECDLHNCIFTHEAREVPNGSNPGKVYDPMSAGDIELPPLKRRKLEPRELASQSISAAPSARNAIVVSHQSESSLTEITSKKASDAITVQPPKQSHKLATPSQPQSMSRTVSPPPSNRGSRPVIVEKVEKLMPRPVAKAPAVLKVRMSFVELLHNYVQSQNSQIEENDENFKEYVLSDQQIIKWVLGEEEQAAARLSSDIYRNKMSQRALQIKKMKANDWKEFVTNTIKSIEKKDHDKDAPGTTGLSPAEEIQVLKFVRTNLAGLDTHGYVTKQPTSSEIQKAKDAIMSTANLEICDRCGVHFQVFPGRNKLGQLTTKGACHYHWAKLYKGQGQRTDHITGQAQSSYSCCGQSAGTEGCTHADTHVFKVTDPKRMAALLQFEQTPTKTDGKIRGPISFDCEMAYTTYGMEVVRVTAVSWPYNTSVLDVLVRPYGEILDLNTRFSGVTQEQFTKAKSYGLNTEDKTGHSSPELTRMQVLQKVDSPAVARQLMFDLLNPDTPLIGHAIDNDLNTCRMIHPFVIDTVLLFPHPRGLPIRFGLKMLASQYLQRGIQTGGAAGHDSKEDSIATGDLVRIKVAEKWQMMRLQGWKFHEGQLKAPGRP